MHGLPYIATPNPQRRVLTGPWFAAFVLGLVAAMGLAGYGFVQNRSGLAWTGGIGALVALLVLVLGRRRPRLRGALVIDSRGIRWPEMQGLDVPWSTVLGLQRSRHTLIFHLRDAAHAMPHMAQMARQMHFDPPSIAGLTTVLFDDADTIARLCEEMVRQTGGTVTELGKSAPSRQIVGTRGDLAWPL